MCGEQRFTEAAGSSCLRFRQAADVGVSVCVSVSYSPGSCCSQMGH